MSTTTSSLFTLQDLLTKQSTHPLFTCLAATDDPAPQSLADMLALDVKAPTSTVVTAVSKEEIEGSDNIQQELQDVMMLTSFISVAASRYLYQTLYKNRVPDITTPSGASEFVRGMANAKNYILTSAMAGFLSSESLLARSFHESTTSADLHLDFLNTLFDGFNFPSSTIKELDSVLTSVTKNIQSLSLSWSDQNSTLDHMVFLYYFDKVLGIDVKVPKVRIYFLHIDQSSWTASLGKSSVNHFEFNMNFSDGIYAMDVEHTAENRANIKALLNKLTGMNLNDLNKLLSPVVVTPGSDTDAPTALK
jgi:hypothetical protein